MKIGISTDGDFFAEYYEATVVSANDYYPFGSAMAGRKYSSNAYRYGFNGMEKDDELKGEGNSYDFGARLYDSRTGRWLAVDPLAAQYVPISPYAFVANKPILYTDLDGRVIYDPKTGKEVKITVISGDNDPAFPTEASIKVEGASEELTKLIVATWNQGPEGRKTIEKLNAEDVKANIHLESKRVIFKNDKGEYGEVGGLGGGHTLVKKTSIKKNKGYKKIYFIKILAISVEGEIVKNKVTEDNINDFVVIESTNPDYKKDLSKMSKKKQQKIIDKLKGSKTNAADKASDEELDSKTLGSYHSILESDKQAGKATQRSVHSLIFETANAASQANEINEHDVEAYNKRDKAAADKVDTALKNGEGAGKRAVVKANEKK